MIEPGSILHAKVVGVEPFGAWLDSSGQRVLVMIPELSWRPVKHPSEFLNIGEWRDVKVLRVNPDNQVVVASLRALDQENNPYRELLLHETYPAFVQRATANEAIVEIRGGIRGPVAAAGHSYEPGDKIWVQISRLAADEGLAEFEIASSPKSLVTSDT